MPPIRERATTKSLLGTTYRNYPLKPLDRPKPLADSSEYDRNRALRGLQYADSTLRTPITKPPPSLERSLIKYRDACADFLDFDRFTEAKFEDQAYHLRWKLAESMQCFEEDMEQAPRLTPAKDKLEQGLQEEVLCLMRWTLYVRHSAYVELPEEWGDLWVDLWKEVKLSLKAEKEDYDLFLAGDNRREEKCEKTLRLVSACDRIGIQLDDIRLIMEANPTSKWVLLNAQLKRLVRCGRFIDLKKTLYDDYQIASLVISPPEKTLLEGFKAHIVELIHFWFHWNSMGDWVNWEPTAELMNRSKIPWDRQARVETEEFEQERNILSPNADFEKVKYEPIGSALIIFGTRVAPERGRSTWRI